MPKDYVVESYSISRGPVPGLRGATDVPVIGGAGYIGSIHSRNSPMLGYRVRVLDFVLVGDAAVLELAGYPILSFSAQIFAPQNLS
jgi:hypothetical protein